MFKGLKTKLADETKRLQATALQVGENLAQSVRNRTEATSEHGSERGSTTGRLVDVLGDLVGVNHSSPTATNGASRVDRDVTSPSIGTLIDISDNTMTARQPALMQEVSEDDLLDPSHTRQRRLSNSSVGSNDSMNFFPSLPALSSNRLETINSDVESTATDLESNAGSAFLGRASKEQISSVLHKLQGRAASYKDKYRDLAKTYNEVVRENDKCRTVLAATQDKALQRIEKLREEKRLMQTRMSEIENQIRSKMDERDQRIADLERQVNSGSVNGNKADESERVRKLEELLNRCKENIRTNKEKISQLTVENDQLRAAAINAENEKENDGGFRDLAAERITAEWRTKLQSSEREWEVKLQEEVERSAMAVAQTKAEVHAALEEKDETLENLRLKYRQMEATHKEEAETNRSRLEEMNSTINALEAEKADMVEKLSKAKQEAVRIVQEEEAKKRDELLSDLDSRFKAKDGELDARLAQAQVAFREELKKVENDWRMRLKEQEEQHLLAIEEREMQKAASFIEQDRRSDDLGATIEQLTTEKLQLTSAIDQLKEKHRRQIDELSATIEANAARHKEEIATMLSAHEEILSSANKDDKDAAASVARQLQETDKRLKEAMARVQQLETELADEVAAAQSANKAAAEMQQRHTAEIEQLRNEFDECQRRADEVAQQRETVVEELNNLRSSNEHFTEEQTDLRQKLDRAQMDAASEMERLNQYVDELKLKVEDKAEALTTALKENESLTIELAASKELSAIHERLQEELDSARRDRDDMERQLHKLQTELKNVTASLESETANSQRLLAELDAAREDFHQKLNDAANSDELTEQHRRQEMTDLTARIETMRQEATESKNRLAQAMSDSSAELEQKMEVIERLNHDVSVIQEQLAAANKTAKEHEEELVVLRAQRDALQSDNDALKVKRDELNSALEAREWDCDKLELQLTEAQSKIDEGAEEATELKEQLKQLEQRLTNAAIEADQAKTALAARDAVAGEAELKDAEMRQQLEAKDAETRRLIEQKDAEMQQLLDEKDAETRQILDAKDAETRNTLDNMKAEIEQLMQTRNSEVGEKQQLINVLQATLAEKDEQITTISHVRATNADQMSTIEQRAQELTETNQKLTEEVANLRSRNEKGTEFLQQLKTEMAQLKDQLTEREQQLEQSQLKIDQIAAECEEKTQKVKSLLADIEVWESSEKEKTSTLEQAKAEIAGLREQLAAIGQGSQNEKLALELRVEEMKQSAQATAGELAQLRNAHEQQLSSLEEKDAQRVALKQQLDSALNQAREKLTALKEQLDQSQQTNQRLEAALSQKDSEAVARAREIESALKQAQDELVAEKERCKELDAARIEIAQLQADMETLKLDASDRDSQVQEAEKTVQETKRKAELKLAKMKKQCETDVQAAKAELLLQLDQLRSDIADRDARLDESRLNLAMYEQRLAEEGENEKIVEEMRVAKETLMDEKDRLAEMAQRATQELDTVRVEMDKLRQQAHEKDGKMEAAAELRSAVQRLEAELLEKEDKISSLLDQSQVDQVRKEYERKLADLAKQSEQRQSELIELHQQELKNASTKLDGDSNRKAKEYQKEVKQLYKDLNERTEELNQATKKYESLLKEREDEIGRLRAAVDSGNDDTVFSDAQAVDHEELQNLRDRVRQQQKDIAEMRERHKREMEGVLQEAAASASATQVDNHHPPLKVQTSHFGSVNLDSFPTSPMFAEPTEAEYLRNVLFRYMNERETLGKELVTLAKVIGTVAKFTRNQLDSVVAKEESRNASWVGGTVNSVQSTVQSVLHR